MLYKKNSEKVLADSTFRAPTSEYRGTPFWAWNCKMTREILEKQIVYLKEMGFGGFHMHSRSGMDNEYLSEEFMSLVRACTDKAKSENMLAWLYDEDRWPSGAAGGLVTRDPKYRARILYFAPANRIKTSKESENAKLVGDKPLYDMSGELPMKAAIAEGKPYFIAAYDVVLDGDGYLKSYKKIARGARAVGEKWIAFSATQGMRDWYNGYCYLDTMSPAAVKRFVEVTHECYKRCVGDEFDKTVPAIFTDEPQFNRCFSYRLECGNDDNVVLHFADRNGVCDLAAGIGEHRLADIVKVEPRKEKPSDKPLEILLELVSSLKSGSGGTPVQPIALYRVDNAYRHLGLASGECRVKSCKVILNVAVLSEPRRLIAYGCGIVTLCVTLHRYPRKVRYSYGYTESRLPISLEFMASEVEIPVRYSVKLGEHCLLAVLMHGGLRLLCGYELDLVDEHIYAGIAEIFIRSHRLAYCVRLLHKSGFLHHMSRKGQTVLIAPLAADLAERIGKALAGMIVIAVA